MLTQSERSSVRGSHLYVLKLALARCCSVINQMIGYAMQTYHTNTAFELSSPRRLQQPAWRDLKCFQALARDLGSKHMHASQGAPEMFIIGCQRGARRARTT